MLVLSCKSYVESTGQLHLLQCQKTDYKWHHIPMQTECVLIKILKHAKILKAEINILAQVTPVFPYATTSIILGFVMCSVIQVYGQPRPLLAKWKIALDIVECTCVAWCEG